MVRTGGVAQPVKYLPCQCEDLGSDFQHLRRRPAMITCLCNHHFGGRRREQGQETHRPWMRSRFETLSQNIRWTAIKENIKRLISSFCMHVTHVPPHTHMNKHHTLTHTNYDHDSHTSVYSLQVYSLLSCLCIFIFVFSYICIILKWHLGGEQVRHKGCVTGEDAIA